MGKSSLQTPVLFLVFNRPATTSQVFERIRKARPVRLYVAADGARPDRLGERDKVDQVRKIATKVDWPCELKTLFQERNLGCQKAVSTAITWLFEEEERGIILEDDCLPHLDFFSFCEMLLDRFEADERVSVITGDNFQNGLKRGDASYYFSKYNHCWGWASWRRAWQQYDNDLADWPAWAASNAWPAVTADKAERRYWEEHFQKVRDGLIDSWAYPWTASVWMYGGLTVTPNTNLVTNIGFGADSTHTKSLRHLSAFMTESPIGTIVHPQDVIRNEEADKYVFDNHFGGKYRRLPRAIVHWPYRALAKIYSWLRAVFS